MGDKYPFLPQGSENLARSPVNSNIPHVCILLTCNSVTGKFKQFSGPEKPKVNTANYASQVIPTDRRTSKSCLSSAYICRGLIIKGFLLPKRTEDLLLPAFYCKTWVGCIKFT